MSRYGAGLALGLVLLRSSAGAQASWSVEPLQEARRTGTFRNSHLDESSGVVASRTQPGVLWSISDSDGPVRVFATDTLGRDLGGFPLPGARNLDWEAISAGPCGSAECLYVADTGDNDERRASVDVYRLAEPQVPPGKAPQRTAPAVERMVVRYPDGPRDVEAAFVDDQGDLHLISKGRVEGFRHYRVPATAWAQGSAVAESLELLPIEKRGGLGRFVTDAALSPAGNRVAVRTYQEIYLFRLTGRGTLRPTGVACRLGTLELQGEGVAWLDEEILITTSEGLLGFPGTVSMGRCSTS